MNNNFEVRELTECDAFQVENMDELSGQGLAECLDSGEYCWGIFQEDTLIGYCSIGYADVGYSELKTHPEWNRDTLLLSDVYIRDEFRHKGAATMLVTEAISLHSESKNNLIFLTLLDSELSNLYSRIGFENISEYCMVRHC